MPLVFKRSPSWSPRPVDRHPPVLSPEDDELDCLPPPAAAASTSRGPSPAKRAKPSPARGAKRAADPGQVGQQRADGDAGAAFEQRIDRIMRADNLRAPKGAPRSAGKRDLRDEEEDVTEIDRRSRRVSPARKTAASTRTPRRAASTASAEPDPDADDRSSPSASPSKKRRRTSLTLKLPAASTTSSHISDAREERARQRAQLQDARLVALEKRRMETEASKEQERVRIKVEPDADKEDDEAVILEAPSKRAGVKAPASSSRRPPPPAPGHLPTPSSPSTVSPILPASVVPPATANRPSSSSRQSARDPPIPSAVPDISTFLSSLPLPSLTRLTPHFHALGCRSPSDLLVLADQSRGVKAREKVLERVGKMDGGLSEWEKIVLEEELEAGWKRWKGGELGGEAEAKR
ncbi:Actin cytoskeleton-regulatory complex protein pan1 [Rhodotorula toruloides ATCC 204091]|uniref:BY PROTMAP: gi/342321344/gb/EGU13278.1/ Actin cytoskeleton-regulatory complex protein pan1 [Rhodotorula glutinis ATCC 204091] n=1 Tax=Rhodotorula toruloides TaxID=5286 RepID=A0A0K3CJA0_RHOTO|nr:Actin cytoskeleton-regulatory complex protein pan1 [Rhodotorula toruloides ATCC 204091]KAK4332325.1 Actin cytoskeleton-regulatory complex protein pan1 [Rhodotorula toruloides]PRQ72605.1 hypothetical protein AAT19DRAFT_16529 [Rhodotorula toruloides]